MLSIFPALLTYQLAAPLILRLTLGAIFFNFGFTKLGRQKNRIGRHRRAHHGTHYDKRGHYGHDDNGDDYERCASGTHCNKLT